MYANAGWNERREVAAGIKDDEVHDLSIAR
jgi:hypothetical protein